MSSFSKFLKKAGAFLKEEVIPLAAGIALGGLGGFAAGRAGGAKQPVVEVPKETGGLPFGLSPLQIGIAVVSVIILVMFIL